MRYFNSAHLCKQKLDELQDTILTELNSLSIDEIPVIVPSFPKRLLAVMSSNGGEIKEY